jgi:hypothetical protein
MIDVFGSRAGSGSGSIFLTSESGSGSRRSKSMWIRWIWVRIRIQIRNIAFYVNIFVVFLLGVTTPPASPATLPPIYLQNFLQSTTVPASSTIFPSIHSQTFLQSDNSDTILALLVFMSFYAVFYLLFMFLLYGF